MPPIAPITLLTLAHADGARGWAQLVRSAERALTSNQGVAPLVAVVLVTAVLPFANWKLAACIQRVWLGRTPPGAVPHEQKDGAALSPGSRPGASRSVPRGRDRA